MQLLVTMLACLKCKKYVKPDMRTYVDSDHNKAAGWFCPSCNEVLGHMIYKGELINDSNKR
jgi:hypothetical protein